MALSAYHRIAYRTMQRFVNPRSTGNVRLRVALQKAHISMRPEVYLSFAYFNMFLAFAGSLCAIALILAALTLGGTSAPVLLVVFMTPLPLLLAFVIYVVTYIVPDMRAGTRARDIESKLPYALNYISTMASAGISPDRIFESLSKQAVYGEVANEAAWITRDIELLGQDLVTALATAIDRSPSLKFQDFLQGAITALTSGEDLKQYFLSKSEQFVRENRQVQERFLDNLGVLAESFVTVVVAAPLLLIVLLSVMIMFGGNPQSTLTMGYVMVVFMLPLAMTAFALTIKSMTPEA